MHADGHRTGDVRPVIARDGADHPFTAWGATPTARHRGVGAGPIEKDQRLRGNRRGPHPSQGTRILIALRGNQALF